MPVLFTVLYLSLCILLCVKNCFVYVFGSGLMERRHSNGIGRRNPNQFYMDVIGSGVIERVRPNRYENGLLQVV